MHFVILADIFLNFHFLLMFHSPKVCEISYKYEKLEKYLSHCYRQRTITTTYYIVKKIHGKMKIVRRSFCVAAKLHLIEYFDDI